jgi:CheY-like chemotaxis protein
MLMEASCATENGGSACAAPMSVLATAVEVATSDASPTSTFSSPNTRFKTLSLPSELIFVCCDDDVIPRIFAESVLLPAACADDKLSKVLGESYKEIKSVPDLVMDLAEHHGHDRVVGLFDQNLTNFHESPVYGTEFCRELRKRGFTGCLVIQSANDEIEAEREYLAAGANGSLGKALRGGADELLSRLAPCYWAANRK